MTVQWLLRSVGAALCACAAALLPLGASAAGTPSAGPLTFIVPFTGGSGPDGVARAVAAEVARLARTSAIVDNRPGGSSVLAATAVMRTPADGRTVLLTGNVAFTGNPHVMKALPYDPVRDFTPVTSVARGPMVLYVHARVPAADARTLMQAVRRQPGRFSFGYTSITSRLPAESMKQSLGLDLLGVPYRSGNAALPDLVAGRIDLLFTDFSAWPYVQAGKLRALAVTDGTRTQFAPDLPTLAELGVPGMDIAFWLGVYLPARAPAAAVARWQGWLEQAVNAPEVQAALKRGGMTAFVLPAGALAGYQFREAQAWGRVIRSAGIAPE